MKQKTGVTIYDLATELNVSPSTVSRALQNHPSIGKATIKAVKELAVKRGYRLNSIAASLRKQQTNNIGVLVSWINRPFISSLISGAEEAARAAGFNVLISQSHDSLDNEKDNVKAFFESRVCGLVVSLAMETQDFEHFNRFLENGTPVVFVDRIPDHLDVQKVIIDNHAAAFKATQHLIDQGCKRIAHFGGALHQAIYRERLRGYKDALQANNLPLDDTIILHGDLLSADEGQKMTEFLLGLPNPPDSIFSANDTAAVSAIQFAKSAGVRIPEDLAIIGFNNDPLCMIIDPPLSSVGHPAADMGRIAVQQILQIKSAEGKLVPQTIMLNTAVIARASSLRKT
ncbi:MAG: LacI family DNA-binding transcriptional regulator [Lewinellaceae bacterium]|nr:LacI family DNA-binding transcriptional regulator [Saprospiraceae bacterium]MCB9315284.1 LacI family DNA-binding transcriptional regulator [Lewinellaceae bacterium]MCB9334413.1 LacI family DNA-binding transcriptional regulator [Lewinellaceae bacterium]